MKKILNQVDDYVDDALQGLCLAHPEQYRRHARRIIVRAKPGRQGKVGIVTGGGSGHFPLFAGYVGQGLVDACAVGNVFAGPAIDDCMQAMEAADHGAGVLRLYGNYGGDKMNFDMAGELLEGQGLRSTSLRVADDIASAPLAERHKRRGVAGLVYVYKIAGAKAEQEGASLEAVTEVATRAAQGCHTIGVALSSCVVPEAGRPTFDIGADEIEMGMGIHGEPGIWRGPLQSADRLADEMLERLWEDAGLARGEQVSLMVNSLGATPLEELYILYARVAGQLAQRGVALALPRVGRYATSMEMAGASISLLRLDSELASLLQAPAQCPFWSV